MSHFAIESNGRKIANPRSEKRAKRTQCREQRHQSRKAKGSSNRAKAQLHVENAMGKQLMLALIFNTNSPIEICKHHEKP